MSEMLRGYVFKSDCFLGRISIELILISPYSSSVFLFFSECFSKTKGQFLISSYRSKMLEKMYRALEMGC